MATHDWKNFVREHLPPLGLSGAREQEIVEEIAQQIEDAYAEAISGGASAADAKSRALAQISDWNSLAREIRRAERPVSEKISEQRAGKLARSNARRKSSQAPRRKYVRRLNSGRPLCAANAA